MGYIKYTAIYVFERHASHKYYDDSVLAVTQWVSGVFLMCMTQPRANA